MKVLMYLFILPLILILAISVFAKNNLIQKEGTYALQRGTYRVASDNAPQNNPGLNATSFTSSRRIITDEVEYPIIRIKYNANSSVHSLQAFNVGHYDLLVFIPRKRNSYGNMPFNGVWSFYEPTDISRDIWMGTPDINLCGATAKIVNNMGGTTAETEIPWGR